jgi:hypothetical protein
MTTTPADFVSRWKELAAVFLKIGAMSYGGPAIMGMLIGSLAPLPLMLGGGLIGAIGRTSPLQRLKELV